jgi:rhodanese-related sulfurtransferase
MTKFNSLRIISCILTFGYASIFFMNMSSCNSFKTDTDSSMMSMEDVNKIINDSANAQRYLILDLRSRMDYVRGHLISAVWMNADSVPNKINTLPKGKKIIVYDANGVESIKTTVLLLKNGFTNIYAMNGGFVSWVKNGYPAAIQLVINTSSKLDITKKDMSSDEIYKTLKDGNKDYSIIDIRSSISYREGHIANALSIPYVPINEFVVGIEEQNFPRNKRLVLYTDQNSNDIGEKATDVLLRNNYTEVYLLKDGMEGWLSKNYPVQ